MDWIDINGTTLRYDIQGSGPATLVLIHEMGGTLESWDHVLPALRPGRRVVRHDWRGAGQSEKLGAPVTFHTMAADIAALRNRGVAPYLYNMPLPRLAAGAYLWRSGAQGFIQWHARMPTADAFDPTDGREGDVQFLWPTPGLCQPADLDAYLFDLVEGAEDLRWFAWLDAAARHNAKAADLRVKLWDTVPDRWAAAERVASRALQWRRDVLDLARNLKE